MGWKEGRKDFFRKQYTNITTKILYFYSRNREKLPRNVEGFYVVEAGDCHSSIERTEFMATVSIGCYFCYLLTLCRKTELWPIIRQLIHRKQTQGNVADIPSGTQLIHTDPDRLCKQHLNKVKRNLNALIYITTSIEVGGRRLMMKHNVRNQDATTKDHNVFCDIMKHFLYHFPIAMVSISHLWILNAALWIFFPFHSIVQVFFSKVFQKWLAIAFLWRMESDWLKVTQLSLSQGKSRTHGIPVPSLIS